MENFDITSVTTIIQLLALILIVAAFYIYRTIRDRNKTIVDLHKLAKTDDVGGLIERAKMIIPIPPNIQEERSYELLKQQIEVKHKQYQLKVSVIVIAIVLFFTTIILLVFFPIDPDKPKTISLKFGLERPKVIGIYPNDVFGPDQKKGLHAAFADYHSGFEIIDLDFLSYKDMRTGKIKPLLDSLKTLLSTGNIIAIVGPSITECTDDIFSLLSLNNSKVPIFVTSAASKDFLKWDEYSEHTNLFRTGSGIDQRANLIAHFLENKEITKKLLFLVESNNAYKPFGQMYFDILMDESDVLRNAVMEKHIEVLNYTDSEESMDSVSNFLKQRISGLDYIFILGVGKQFKQLLNTFYRNQTTDARLPKIGGWMNGYCLNDEICLDSCSLYNNCIFEITDLNLDRAKRYDMADPRYLRSFENTFKTRLHPGMRDMAICYDAGICIMETYRKLLLRTTHDTPGKWVVFTPKALKHLVYTMHHSSFDGVSSRIEFDESGINKNITLDCAIFDSSKRRWKHKLIQDLLEL